MRTDRALGLTPIGLTPIGWIESCFKEKFGIPRQSGLVKEARAVIHLPRRELRNAVDGLEGLSHLWVVFIFHEATGRARSKTHVRPPRLGGSKKIGVFASRSPHRPNPIGLSAVALERIETSGTEILLHVSGGDFLDGTPVLDLKPYIPYSDSIPKARALWTGMEIGKSPASLPVRFTREALAQCRSADPKGARGLKGLISSVLKQDPRPASQRKAEAKTRYAFLLHEFDVHWEVEGGKARVLELKTQGDAP